MKLADDFPFYADLVAPVHSRSLRDAEASPAEDEVAIDETWALEIASPSPQAEAAADDLREFFSAAMGIDLQGGGEGRIVLRVDSGLDESPEAHAIDAAPDRIEIIGASPAALIHGVVFAEDLMRQRRAPFLPLGRRQRRPLFRLRIHRSPVSPFYVEELTGFRGAPYPPASKARPPRYPGWEHEDAGPDAFYHDNILRRLAHHGMNGIWIRGALCRISKSSAFPEFGDVADQFAAQLRRLCERAERFGIRVFLYFNEPLGLPADDPIWAKYPDCRGSYASYHDRYCMCTSNERVQQFLREAMAWLFSRVPQLGGVILISASEFPTHCYSHVPTRPGSRPVQELVEQGIMCPRCAQRSAQEVVAEVVTLIRDGVKSANPDADVIAWNWSWSMYEPDPQEGILRLLPEDVIVMGDFERGIKTQALGFQYDHDEYSLKIIGPSDRFNSMAHWEQARGREVFAKIQIGTTHEDGNVPYLPVLDRLAAKYLALKNRGVAGIMCCWNFGNMPSLATELAGIMSWSDAPETTDEALRALAARNFGPAAVDAAMRAWRIISEAMEDFPSSIPVMYYGPVNRSFAFRLSLERQDKPFPRSWLLDLDEEGDDLQSCTKPFGPEHVVRCFRAVAGGFERGAQAMLAAADRLEGADAAELRREANVAMCCALQMRSAANIIEFIMLRNRWLEAPDGPEKQALQDRMVQVLHSERAICLEALQLVDGDPRLGFHGEAYGYLFNRPLIERKLANLSELLAAVGASD